MPGRVVPARPGGDPLAVDRLGQEVPVPRPGPTARGTSSSPRSATASGSEAGPSALGPGVPTRTSAPTPIAEPDRARGRHHPPQAARPPGADRRRLHGLVPRRPAHRPGEIPQGRRVGQGRRGTAPSSTGGGSSGARPASRTTRPSTDADIASSNLILWGDPESNAVLKRIADKLPIKLGRGQDRRRPEVVPGRHPRADPDLPEPAQPVEVCGPQQRVHVSATMTI